jgi:hypothetical protein
MDTVILIGAARSGTKFLRSLLGADSQVGEVPFDVNYIWRHGNEACQHDAIPAALATPRVKSYIRRALTKQARIRGGRSILLEKTVSNTLRVPFVLEVFPDARFIHLIRDGRDVVESALRMWHKRPDWGYLVQKARSFPVSNYRYAAWYLWNLVSGGARGKRGMRIWGPRYPGIDTDLAARPLIEICARQWALSVEYARRDLAYLPAEQVMTVHYESLVANESVVAEVARFAGVSSPKSVVEYYQKTVRKDLSGGWERLTSMDRIDVEGILSEQLSKSGYDIHGRSVHLGQIQK